MKSINIEQAKVLVNNKSIPEYSPHWRAKGFIEGVISPDVYKREDIKRLVEALAKIIWVISVSIEREGSSESKVRIGGIIEEALSHIPKETKEKI